MGKRQSTISSRKSFGHSHRDLCSRSSDRSICWALTMKKPIDLIRLSFSCSDCDKEETSVPISEAVYNGPPLCPECEKEMTIDYQLLILE